MKVSLFDRVSRHLERRTWTGVPAAELRQALADFDALAARIDRARRRVSQEFSPELSPDFEAARATIRKLLRDQGRGRSRWAAAL